MRTRVRVAGFSLALAVFLAATLPVRADGPIQYPGFVQPDPEQEYYRGIFDLCKWSMGRSGMSRAEATTACLYIAKWAENGNWYGLPSDGWKQMERAPAGWGSGV